MYSGLGALLTQNNNITIIMSDMEAYADYNLSDTVLSTAQAYNSLNKLMK